MTTPTNTAIRAHLEAVTPDAVLDAEPRSPAAAPVIRELDRRWSDGIDVRMLWVQTDDQVIVAVSDAKTGAAFQIEVAAHEALEVFHHPYAHAAFRGLDSRED